LDLVALFSSGLREAPWVWRGSTERGSLVLVGIVCWCMAWVRGWVVLLLVVAGSVFVPARAGGRPSSRLAPHLNTESRRKMDPTRKTLRMVTYGLYVATSQDAEGPAAARQLALAGFFEPPLVMAASSRTPGCIARLKLARFCGASLARARRPGHKFLQRRNPREWKAERFAMCPG